MKPVLPKGVLGLILPAKTHKTVAYKGVVLSQHFCKCFNCSVKKPMHCEPFQTDHFGFDGRGPEIRRFIYDRDRIVPGTFTDRAQPSGNITGVEYFWFERPELSWVIFEGLQVIQIVPEEVCSYWFHLGSEVSPVGFSGVTEIHDSPWKAGFAQRHLQDVRHFVLEFYDDIVEVLCKNLVFGSGEFRIEDQLELSYYKPWPPR